MACSAAYEKVKKIDTGTPNTFHQYLLSNYQQNASFEAEEMHDWNSAKLYSEKALRAMSGENIYPEKITYWKIPEDKLKEIRIGYDNLISIYEEAIIKDPQNLAKAISSLDCWAEQEEEKWQTWDIAKCKDDFVKAMHEIYNNLLTEKKDIEAVSEDISTNTEDKNQVAIVTQSENKELMQLIYFDFDDFKLSEISLNTLKNFINKINELEWHNNKIYANTYQFNKEVGLIIEPTNGQVEGVIDFTGLKERVKNHPKLDVLNGIAYNKITNSFFLSKKTSSLRFKADLLFFVNFEK